VAHGHQHVDPGNPLDLATALRFGFLLAVIMVLAHGATMWLGNSGLYLLAAVDGLLDVDAISLSAASMAATGENDASRRHQHGPHRRRR
jgi:uncharacterized membrane protein (DUF4010 family)